MRSVVILHNMLFILLLTGCTVGPKYEPPCFDIPEQWHRAPGEEMECRPTTDFIWWRSLNDPILNSLIETAADQNLDLCIAAARILEARTEWKGKTGDLYPHIDASLTAGHLYYGDKKLLKDLVGCSHTCHSGKRNINFFEAGFDASWEIDLFGAAKHEINALQARLESWEESYQDAWVTLSAEVARNYIELRSLQQRRIIVHKNIESQKDTVGLINELLRIGHASTLDLLQSEGVLKNLEAQVPSIDFSIEKAINRMTLLLGETPGSLCSELAVPGRLPQLPCEMPIGLPSELLRRRPDIRKAERELAAATESIGAAVAALFPRLSLNGFIGDISTQLKNLSNGSGATWFAAPQLLFPIFNSRLLQQDVALNKIRARQALLNYQKTVLSSLEEVETSLAAYRYEGERRRTLEQALQKEQEAYHLAFDLYQRGLKDYLGVLEINRSLLSGQDAWLQSETQLLIHYISLYKALGGGWTTYD